MIGEILWFGAAVLVSLGFVWGLYVFVRDPLSKVLDDLLGMATATAFYARWLLVSLVVIGLGGINDADFGVTEDTAPMEVVWRIAEYVYDMLGWVLAILALLLVSVTVLIATKRRPHEQ